MIDKNLPEPPLDRRFCVWCGRTDHVRGELVHWPSADCDKPVVRMLDGAEIEPFSYWHYLCQWCRAAETRRRTKMEGKGHEQRAF